MVEKIWKNYQVLEKGITAAFYHLVNVIVGSVLDSIINRRTVLRLLNFDNPILNNADYNYIGG